MPAVPFLAPSVEDTYEHAEATVKRKEGTTRPSDAGVEGATNRERYIMDVARLTQHQNVFWSSHGREQRRVLFDNRINPRAPAPDIRLEN